MMRSSFAVIDEAVSANLALEQGKATEVDLAVLDRHRVRSKRTRNIAGLRIVSNAAQDAELDPESKSRLERILAFASDRAAIEAKLASSGVKPLAVLPLASWNTICERTGLYRFAPKGNRVKVSGTDIVKEADEKAPASAIKQFLLFGMFIFAIGLSVAIGSAKLFALASSVHSVLGGLCILTAIAGTLMALLGALANMIMLDSGIRNRLIHDSRTETKLKLIRSIAKKKEKDGSLFASLWPNYQEPNSGPGIAIEFPDPPEDVQETLRKVERVGLRMCIAAVPEAIRITEDVGDVLAQETIRALTHEERLTWQKDPIVYVVTGSAVAVVAQFGEFPIEQKVVEEVVSSIHLV